MKILTRAIAVLALLFVAMLFIGWVSDTPENREKWARQDACERMKSEAITTTEKVNARDMCKVLLDKR